MVQLYMSTVCIFRVLRRRRRQNAVAAPDTRTPTLLSTPANTGTGYLLAPELPEGIPDLFSVGTASAVGLPLDGPGMLVDVLEIVGVLEMEGPESSSSNGTVDAVEDMVKVIPTDLHVCCKNKFAMVRSLPSQVD